MLDWKIHGMELCFGSIHPYQKPFGRHLDLLARRISTIPFQFPGLNSATAAL